MNVFIAGHCYRIQQRTISPQADDEFHFSIQIFRPFKQTGIRGQSNGMFYLLKIFAKDDRFHFLSLQLVKEELQVMTLSVFHYPTIDGCLHTL